MVADEDGPAFRLDPLLRHVGVEAVDALFVKLAQKLEAIEHSRWIIENPRRAVTCREALSEGAGLLLLPIGKPLDVGEDMDLGRSTGELAA